jgi:TP901 family phage tail tape measure protein
MAKNVGLTTTEVANLSIAFFRQGRSAVDALRLTETAAKFAKIAAIDVNDAANFLTAAINGFNLAASDATRIIDKFAALGAGAAASASEIAIALSKVAPAAASAGVEIDNLMAFVTKGIETTREAPENIGTAFKTIFARMRELTDIGKTVEDGMDVNRVEASLRSIGVALRDGNGEFRNLDEVLLEVGARWDSIDRNQQAYLATTLAGTRQQTRLIALFEDFDRTLELIELSQDSAGVAALQHAEYMNGLEAANTRLRTSFQQLITSFVNSEMVIGFINLLNDVLELANTGLGKLVVTAGLLTLGITALSKVKAINTAITVIQAAAEENYLRALGKTGNMTGAAAKGTGVLTIAKMKLIAVTKALGAAIMGIPVVG